MIKQLAVQFLMIILSYLIPKNKKLIISGSGPGNDFRGNPKYFFLYMNKKHKDYMVLWSAGTKKLKKELKDKNLPVFYRYSLKGLYNILRAKYFIIEKSSKDVYYTDFIFGKFNFLQTWHGITIKKLGKHAVEEKKGLPGHSFLANEKLWNFMKKRGLLSMMKYKLILSTTENQEMLLKDIFMNENVHTLGYPRNDIFYRKDELTTEDYSRLLNLTEFDKIFLYAPTFRDSKSNVKPFSNNFLKELNQYFSKKNYLLIIKKHPLQKNIEIPAGLSNIKDYSEKIKDLHEILIHTDVLISDYSSAVNDFILTGKPNIYYNYDLEEYLETCRGFYYDYYEIFSGPFADNEKTLIRIIKNLDEIVESSEYKALYTKQLNFFHKYKDGNSSERLFEFIKAL